VSDRSTVAFAAVQGNMGVRRLGEATEQLQVQLRYLAVGNLEVRGVGQSSPDAPANFGRGDT